MTISDYAENKLLDAVFNFTTTGGGLPTANPYIALFTADPGETGASGEVAGGSYARQQSDFAVAASGTLQNNANIDFASMPAVSGNGVVGWGAFDAVTAGNCLWTGFLSLTSGLAEVRSGDLATDDVQSVAHGLVLDNRVIFEVIEGLTIPAGLTAGTIYWIITTGLTTDAFRVSTTQGGGAANITAAGSAIWRLVGNKTVNSGDTFRIATGDLDVFLD